MQQTQQPVKFSCSFHVKEFGHQFGDDSDPIFGKLACPYPVVCNLQQKNITLLGGSLDAGMQLLYSASKTKFTFL